MKEIRILERGLYTTDPAISMSATRTSTATASFYIAIKAVSHTASSGKKKLICAYCKGAPLPYAMLSQIIRDYQKGEFTYVSTAWKAIRWHTVI